MLKSLTQPAAAKPFVPLKPQRQAFGSAQGFHGNAGYTNTGGMFTPKPRPELNKVQTVGNPLLRMMGNQ